jgi:hypothetical protein
MIRGSCHCGAVAFEVAVAPQEVTDCNCSICRRYGVLWAYYSPAQVHFQQPPATDVYMWDDKSIRFHRCRICGCMTHWWAVAPLGNRMGINARMLAPDILAQARVRLLDGAVTERYLDE